MWLACKINDHTNAISLKWISAQAQLHAMWFPGQLRPEKVLYIELVSAWKQWLEQHTELLVLGT